MSSTDTHEFGEDSIPTPTENNTLLEQALAYARRGWPVFACHTPAKNGCSCGKADCKNVGKHPRWHEEDLAHGLKSATTDEQIIRAWWERWPEANIGIATGKVSGLVVLDVDPRHSGNESLEQLEEEHGSFPDTIEAITGSGGRHIFFAHPGTEVRNKAGFLPGLDIRGDGGYVIAPPSLHACGGMYEWELSSHPDQTPLAAIPEWLFELIQTKSEASEEPGTAMEADKILVGQRNNALASLAGSMRRKGLSEAAIEAALLTENLSRCEPPLSDEEVGKIARSIGRYDPGPAIKANTPPSTQAQFRYTEMGNAELMVAQHGLDLRYCTQLKKWLIFDGIRWAVDPGSQVYERAKATIRSLYKQASNIQDQTKRQELVRHAMSSESHQKITAMIKLASREKGIPVQLKELDRDPMLLNVLNGTLDLHTGKLLPHSPDHLITKLAPVAYDPEANCPLWTAFLQRIMNNNLDMLAFLQRLAGYTLIGDNRERVFFILWGTGDNGKTTFIETIRALLGDYAQTAEFSTFLKRGAYQIRNDLAKLQGARFVSASEGEEGARLNTSLLKSITGGDTITARKLYAEYVDFLPACKIFLATNFMPKIQDNSQGLWRRLRLIPFTVTIPLAEQDGTLKEKLKQELPGILSWVARGCLDWQKYGLGTPPEVHEATQEYREKSDVIGLFFKSCCILEPGAKVATKDLKEAFSKWAEENGEDSTQIKNLKPRLTELKLSTRRSGKSGEYCWHGIRLA
jgi:putative DNA primase/helicase